MDNKKLGLRTFFNDQKQSGNKTDTDSQSAKILEGSEKTDHTLTKKSKHSEDNKKNDLPIVAPVKIFDDLKKPKDKIVLMDKKETVAAQDDNKLPEIPQPTKNIEIVDNDNTLGNATIITDTKKSEFSLFSAMAESIKKTFTKLKNRKPAEEKYTVADTSVRKEIVQKATSQSGKNVASDYQSAQELIKQRIEKDSHEQHKVWTPNTESGYVLLNSANEIPKPQKNVSSTNFYIEQRDIVVDSLNNVLSSGENTDRWGADNSKPKPEKPKVPEVIETPKPKEIPPTITTPVSVPAPIPVQKKETPAINNYQQKLNVQEVVKQTPIKTVKPNADLKNKFYNTNTNTLSFIVVGFVFVVVLFSGLGNLLIKSEDESSKVDTSNLSKVINSDLEFVFQPILTRTSIINRIEKENSASEKAKHFVLTADENNKNIIKPSNLMNYLRFRSGSHFNESVSSIYFGQVAQNKPFVILKVTDNNTAKGGMLNWEQFMSQDLNEILNLDKTTDNATTTPEIISLDFKDGMISAIDVRFLEINNKNIVYGFANSNTIIITNSNEAFGELLELIQP